MRRHALSNPRDAIACMFDTRYPYAIRSDARIVNAPVKALSSTICFILELSTSGSLVAGPLFFSSKLVVGRRQRHADRILTQQLCVEIAPFTIRPKISLKRLREGKIDRTGYAKGKNDGEMQILCGTWDICLIGGAAELPVTTETLGYASNLFLVFPRTAFSTLLMLSSRCVWQCRYTA